MIWLDWNWRQVGLGGYIEHAPACATFQALMKVEIWLGPLTMTGRWEQHKEATWRENKRR